MGKQSRNQRLTPKPDKYAAPEPEAETVQIPVRIPNFRVSEVNYDLLLVELSTGNGTSIETYTWTRAQVQKLVDATAEWLAQPEPETTEAEVPRDPSPEEPLPAGPPAPEVQALEHVPGTRGLSVVQRPSRLVGPDGRPL